MASGKKYVQQSARKFYALSFADGALSPERVGGVLAYVEKHRPPQASAVLKAYQRLIAAELARGEAVVEHAGPLNSAALENIAQSMTRKYGRKVTATGKRNDALLAGLRVRVGDDLYEHNVASQLAALAAAV